MRYLYAFYTEIAEVPFYVVDGNIVYTNIEHICGIEVEMDLDDNIDFKAGIIGYGFDTDNIKDYKTLLAFLEEHYNEIKEDEVETNPFTRKELIDELITVCKEKYRKI